MSTHLVYLLEQQRYAIPLTGVERIARAVEITPLRGALPPVLGVINVGGEAVPVISMRQHFGLPSRETELADRLIIVRTGQCRLALQVDAVQGVNALAGELLHTSADTVAGASASFEVARLEEELLVLHDVAELILLEPAEERDLVATGWGV